MVSSRTNPISKTKAKIILVDDHPIVRRGLAELINQESDLEVSGDASSAADAIKAIDTHQPDLVIVDISLEDTNGIELIKNLRARYTNLRLLVLSMHDEAVYAERALRAGARGYIMKQVAMDEVVTAVRRVLSGKLYLSERMSNKMLYQLVGETSDMERSPIDRLTDRELQVFQLIGQGLTTRQIAEKLHLSVKTVETHREHLKEKLNLSNGAELVRYAIQWALEEPRDLREKV